MNTLTARYPLRWLAAILWIVAARGIAAPITVCLDENPWPPYSFLRETTPGQPPELTGFTVELATAALQALGQDFQIRHLPWAVVHQKAKSANAADRCDMIWDISTNPERETYLYFTDPIYKLHYTLMYPLSRFPRGAPLRQMTDLKAWKTCGVKDYNYGSLPSQINLQRAESIQDALNLLQRKECDFFLIEASVMERGQAMGLYKSAPLGCVAMDGMSKAYRLAVSHLAENAMMLHANLRKVLDGLRRSGVQGRLARRYQVVFPQCSETLP